MTDPTFSLREGSRIGPYTLQGILGEGGMGEVWQAQQNEPVQRTVALKVLKAGMDSKQVVARFEAERQALAVMDHPSIATVFDAGTTPGGRPFFVMELVKGVPITDFCDQKRLSTRDRVILFTQVSRAVQHAHQKGVIHRDLKPSNVLVVDHDGHPLVKVIDFGIARAVESDGEDGAQLTQVGHAVGTPAYMAPEQLGLEGSDIDTRADIYSLGVLLYQLLSGSLPFDTEAYRGLAIVGTFEKEPPTPSQRFTSLSDTRIEIAGLRSASPPSLQRELRGDLDWIVIKAMAAERNSRYDTANALTFELERFLHDEPVLARPPSRRYRASKFIRRHRGAVAAAGLAFSSLVAATGVTSAALLETKRAEAQRAQEAATAETVSDFMVGLFEIADPGETQGNAVTAREILDDGATRVRTELSEEPRVLGRMLHTMGEVYVNLGLFDQAEELMEEALETRRTGTGDRSLETAETLDRLGDLYRKMGQYERAEELIREGLSIRTDSLGEEALDVARSLNNLALVRQAEDDFEQAEELFLRSLAARRAAAGTDQNLDVALALHNLGNFHSSSGRDTEAADSFARQALEIRRSLLGEIHPRVASTLGVLGGIALDRGDLAQAETLQRQSLEIERTLYGEVHPQVTSSLGELGLILMDQGRGEEGEALLREVLERDREALAPDHPDLAIRLNNLAWALQQRGKYREAGGLFLESLTLRRKVHGDRSSSVARAVGNYGRFLMTSGGDLREAEALIEESAQTWEAIHGSDHPDFAVASYSLGQVRARRGNHGSAVTAYNRAIAAWGESLSPDHPNLGYASQGLGLSLLEVQRLPEAEEAFLAAAEVFRARLPETTEHLGTSLLRIGQIRTTQERFLEAEAPLQEALDLFQEEYGVDSPGSQRTLRSLVALYEAWDKLAEARTFREALQSMDSGNPT
jgi:non-specific serine/threonine protein kinase/serine/threonine-protein kinase